MIVDLENRSRFDVEAAIDFIIGRVISLAIGKAILTETNVAIGFFRLSL